MLCSQDFLFQSYCDSEKMDNNCYLKTVVPLGNCLDPIVSKDHQVYAFEHRGNDSRCFSDESETRSYCLKYTIVKGKVNMIIGPNSYVCDSDDQVLSIKYRINEKRSYNLKLKCPKLDKFIEKHIQTACPENCNSNGFCQKGKCMCFEGFNLSDNCRSSIRMGQQDFIFSETLVDSLGL